jgi:hypothetical protein
LSLTSDTIIGVVRAQAIGRHLALAFRLADDEPTPLVVAGGAQLWLVRVVLAQWSTAAGFWLRPAGTAARRLRIRRQKRPARPGTRTGTETARFIPASGSEHGYCPTHYVRWRATVPRTPTPTSGISS